MKYAQFMLLILLGTVWLSSCTRSVDVTHIVDSGFIRHPDTSGQTKPPVDTPKKQTKPGAYDLYLQVLEYQTNMPVDSVKLTKYDCTGGGCPTQGVPVASWMSDSNGIILINGYDTLPGISSLFGILSRNQYWDRWSFDSVYVNASDSVKHAVVHVYPKAWLNIHIKNTLYNDSSRKIIFRYEPNVTQPGMPSEYLSSPDYFDWTRSRLISFVEANLDVTFMVPTFAFIETDVWIFEGTGAGSDAQIYYTAKTAGKFDILNVDIEIK